ncbi:MAG: PQQ-binding-like beta-propeller repeat protein, partial [Planctomycetes bacterium]|nr:PQQ-binding-like beta-propeller repeat protein [Planctomycetota bacterium]
MSCWSPTLPRCLLLAAGLHLSVAIPAAAWQERTESEVLRRVQTAALPESNEAMLLAGRAGDAVKQGDFRLAIELIEQIMNLPDALVADPENPVYYPVWRQARRLLSALPPDGLTYYRQIVDPEAGVSFREAIESSDVAALRRLFRAYPVSSVAPRIGSELVSRLMEGGDYAQAVDMLHELDSAAAGDDDAFARRARLVVSLARLGAWQSAVGLLELLERDQATAGDRLAGERIERLRTWIAELRRDGDSHRGGAEVALVPAMDTEISWERSLRIAAESGRMDDDVSIARAIDEHRRLPLVEPIIAGDALVVRLGGQLWVHDLLSLTRRWQAAEITADDQAHFGSVPRFGQPMAPVEVEGDESDAISSETRDLLFYSLRHAVSVGLGNVYTIESLSGLPEPSTRRRFRRGLFRRQDEHVLANFLVARELATGRQVWKAGADLSDPLYGVAFQDTPIVVGDELVVPVQRDDDILLCALDPASGRVLREMPIVGPPTAFSGAGGRCLLARDDTTIYVCTGNGIIAAISGATWEWKWAAAYPSTLGKQLARRVSFRFGRGAPRSGPPMRPFIAGDLLIVAPIDSSGDEIMALDRFSGRVRWRTARGDHVAIAGVIDDRLILCGNTVTCVDLADGNTVLWRSIPIELSGRPVIHGRRVYVPARDALLVLDVDTGKIVDDQLYAAGEPGVGNLAASDDALLSVSPRRIVKYPDLTATRANCDRIIAARDDDPRARLSLAWIEMLTGDYQSALNMIEAMGSADPPLETEREELLVRLFVSLSHEAPAGQDKLSWLRRAETLSLSSRTAGQMGMLIGRALDEAGRLDEALAHYRGMLLAADSPMINHAGRRIVAWLHAARRAGALLSRVSEAQRREWEDDLLSALVDGGQGDEMLRRGLLVVDGAAAQRLSRALLIQSRRPEVVIDYLPEPDDDTLPLPERRALQLARWETHLALGMIDQAERDRDYWREVLAVDIP